MPAKVLVVDVGGTHLKILASGQKTPHKIASGPKMTAKRMVRWVKKAAKVWPHDVATIGYPGPVETLPSKTRLGANGNAFLGGYRLWSNKRGNESFDPSGQ